MIIAPDEKVTLFEEEFFIKQDSLKHGTLHGYHNGECITASHADKFHVLEEIVIYYENTYMKLEHFVENINEGSKMWVNEDPDNRFVALLSEDVKYWQEKGINTVPQLRHYLDKFEVMV